MKNVLLLFLTFFSFCIHAQDAGKNTGKKKFLDLSPRVMNTINKFSVHATFGTPSLSTKEISQISTSKLNGVSLADLSIGYKMNPRLSFGLSLMGNLGNCTSGYYNGEGLFTPYSMDDDDDDDDIEDENEDCDEDELEILMGTVMYKLSERFPLFVQVGGGYSLGGNAPAYTAMIGYNQKIFSNLGLIAGIRFSDVLYKKPAEAISATPTQGFKFELGLSWNL